MYDSKGTSHLKQVFSYNRKKMDGAPPFPNVAHPLIMAVAGYVSVDAKLAQMLRLNSGAGYHEDAPVAVSVDAPQLEVGLGFDGGGPRGPVDQSQFSETTAFPDAGHPLAVHVHLRREGETGVTTGALRSSGHRCL